MSEWVFVFDWDYTLGLSTWKFENDQLFSETERGAIREKNKERYTSWKAGAEGDYYNILLIKSQSFVLQKLHLQINNSSADDQDDGNRELKNNQDISQVRP